MSSAHNTLESIKYRRGVLQLLDQRRLPLETVYCDITSIDDICCAIKEMRVRGAPAIAVSAALALAVVAERELKEQRQNSVWKTADDMRQFLLMSCDKMMSARPTAVNLSKVLIQLKKDIETDKANTMEAVLETCVQLAEKIYAADVSFNERIMRHGAAHLLKLASKERVNILTICNTGALATSRYGTALGIVRQLFYEGHLQHLYACETRPWNQGARLTVYECVQENIPCTLICDSAVSAVMKTHDIDAVVVGADRICKNGDTANKIGTYNLAVAAAYHKVPFFVAAPSTTLDPLTPDGEGVVIEEREATEITHIASGGGGLQSDKSNSDYGRKRVVADGPHLKVWNPVFDITPASLITGGIITEHGVFPPATAGPLFDISRIVEP
ncbi:translation initiation factor 2 subunit, putative [Trypanosoma equiperdum]|uniref:Methylthioribose-1-phosphate isomerase n=2 Tax=Trypanozoon TaxID=39700 RepID=MTNA_TRYB2|nr:translation initiation factor 2 subunit, putative [Trypanosoma brucei brucei TREU927]Q383H9.1 RecName: Full=Methylthioribose-1-phosphate isomerase; Short=M1Pi; Short=MTR-1-P isomerase; AltName: Full=S-methyl-5-thioribose-1-phosphate isomerase; AltName: Full=Translation initiation factor eIF-2B subunit alpha/beta/delta-like protein [Trypanosoma brucei brucei TREU927]EAN80052.1 translation initiation factor 2 subunit, putative [Trypanosoma brucei brucei TREU927]SCU70451.1 translation initiation